jgi:hypothetical protein
VLPLLVAHVGDRVVGHLVRRVAHEDVQRAELADGALHQAPAVRRVGEVAGQQQRPLASILDQGADRGGIRLLGREVGDRHVGPLAGEGDRHRPPDSAVGTGDQGHLAGDPARTAVGLLTAVRDRLHPTLQARRCLVLCREPHVSSPGAARTGADPADHADRAGEAPRAA